jgi:hypothetical protein
MGRNMFRRALIIVSSLIVLLIPNLAVAQTAQTAGQGLEISPPLKELKADPGQTVITEIRLRNVTKGPLVTKSEVNDFVAAGEDGQPKLLLDNNEQSPYSIKSWLSTIPSVTLNPGEQKPIPITMTVPKNAGPGGHYGVVRFTGRPPELEDSGVSLSASVGTLMLVNVSGNVSESAQISEMYASQKDKQRSLFEYGPVTIIEKIKNTGNTHFKPKGNVRVTNMFGKEVGMYQLNEKGGNVLPGSTRKFEQTLNKKFMFGRYKAQADVVYGSDSKILSRTISFWVIPYKLILIVLAAIALIIFLIRQYNKAIVKKASKKSSSKKKDDKKDKS